MKVEEASLKISLSQHITAIEKARTSFGHFVAYTMPDYKLNWHNILLMKYLQAMVDGKINRLMVFMPPRHGKSELVSRRLPAYLFGIRPNINIIGASYSMALASKMNRDVQRIMFDPRYHATFPDTRLGTGMTHTKNEVNYLKNTEIFEIADHKGIYRAAGVGTGITGMGLDFGIIDDPVKDQEAARSEIQREKAWEWFTSTFYTRAQKNAKILITLTRWHEDDLAGRIQEKMKKGEEGFKDWKILSLPGICEQSKHANDIRKTGEALWPEEFNLTQLNEIKNTIGPSWWRSLYQQSPTADGGGMFDSTMFEFASVHTVYDFTFITADTAYNDKQENDFTVMAAWGYKFDKLFLIDIYRKRIKAAEMEIPALAFMKKHSISWGFRGAYIEPAGHGIYLNQLFRKLGLIMPSEEQAKDFFSDRRMNKTERANNAVPHLTTRKVYINNDIGIKDELLSEVLAFPKGKNDDFVDCLVDAVKMAYTQKLSLLDVL